MYEENQIIEWEGADGVTIRGRIFDVPDDETLHVVVMGEAERIQLVIAELKSRPRIVEAE